MGLFRREAATGRPVRRVVSGLAIMGLVVAYGTVGMTAANATPAPPTMRTFSQTGSPYPYRMATDSAGDVYVQNDSGGTVSKISAAGAFTQNWYSAASGLVDLAVDPSGNVWLPRVGSGDAVEEVSAAGTLLHTYQTQPTGLPDQIYIANIAIDRTGNVYVDYQYGNSPPFDDGVAKISAAGIVTPAWAVLPAGFNVGQMVVDATGNVYVLGTNDLAKITPAGVVSGAWASPGGGGVGDTIDAAGNIYVINSNTIVKVAPNGTMNSSWAAVAVGDAPDALTASPAGDIYALNEDTNNDDGTVSKITAAGAVTETWATLPPHAVGQGYGNYPYGILSDPSGNIYVSLFYGSAIVRLAAPATAPPTAPHVVAGTSSATVSWTAPSPSTGITGYTVTAHPGPATCTTHSASVTHCVIGATAGKTYTYTVVAHGASGVSSAVTTAAVVASVPVVAATVPTNSVATLTTTNGPITTAKPGQAITVVGSGLLAYSTVVVAVYSTPIVLARVVTTSHGGLAAPITIPDSLEPGPHTLVAYGVGPAGAGRSATLSFTLVALAATGAPTAELLEVGLLCLLAGAAMMVAANRRRRPDSVS